MARVEETKILRQHEPVSSITSSKVLCSIALNKVPRERLYVHSDSYGPGTRPFPIRCAIPIADPKY